MNSERTNKPSPSEIKAIITRFNDRLDQALCAAAPSKEWVRSALHRKGAPRCPVRLKRLSLDVIVKYGDALADLFCQYPEDTYFAAPYEIFLGFQSPGRSASIDPIEALTEDSQWTDEWGTLWRHAEGGVGASTVSNPLQDWSQLDAYLTQMPDPRARGRLSGAEGSLKLHGKSRYFAGMTHMLLYERMHCLRGMENTFEDFYVSPEQTDRLLGELADYFLDIIRSWGEMADVDAIFVTDDWGTQQALMISPKMWRKFFASRYRRLFDEAHRCGLDVIFHSCGNVTEIIGGLIDLGIDVLDPIQPEAMDLKEIARQFGGKVAFCGGLSDQRLAVCSPAQVKDEVRRAIDTLGGAFKNAYIVAPSNVLTPEIPLENIQALFEACHNQ